MVEYLPKWHRIDELIEMVQSVGVQRPKYKAGTSTQLFGWMCPYGY